MRQPAYLTGLLLITALVAGTACAGDYYKWTDAHGTVHYSQTPPPGHAASTVHVSDGVPTAPLPVAGKGSATQEQKAGAKSSATALERTDTQAMSSNCAIAKKNIANLQGHGMVVASGDPDKARALDPEQRDQALADARKEAATYCAHQP